MTVVPAYKSATGPIAAAFADDPWLYSYDLPDGKDVTVKVEDVPRWDALDIAGTKHRNVFGLKFVGKKKILLLTSKAVFKAMAKLHGKDFDGWKGKEITLFVDEVDAFGQTVDAIRIRTPKRGRGRSAQVADRWLDDDPGPGAPPAGSPPISEAGDAKPAAAVQSDADRWKAFRADCERATGSFGGERLFIKQAPPKSGQWYTCDAALADPPLKLYDENALALAISADELAGLTEKLERAIA